MFKNNDKSFNLIRKITNVAIFVAMCVCVVMGIVLIAMSFPTVDYGYGAELIINPITLLSGIFTLLLGPVVCQLIWLALDLYFNALLDIKLIRNELCKEEAMQELPVLFKKMNRENDVDNVSIYKKLREYRALVEESVITEDEFAQIKTSLMSNAKTETDSVISKAKELKKLADEKVITEQEFANEKSKILK